MQDKVIGEASGDGRGKWDEISGSGGVPAGSYTLARGLVPAGVKSPWKRKVSGEFIPSALREMSHCMKPPSFGGFGRDVRVQEAAGRSFNSNSSMEV